MKLGALNQLVKFIPLAHDRKKDLAIIIFGRLDNDFKGLINIDIFGPCISPNQPFYFPCVNYCESFTRGLDSSHFERTY